MSRNLVICCDGTNNEFGPENTNVVRLVQVLDRDPKHQLLYYDPGVGTLPEPNAFWKSQKWISKVLGLAFGAGLSWKVGEAYTYLMETWEPGDRVFLFGFSRGAYTVRVLAGMLHALGLLPRNNPNLIPYALRLFGARRGSRPTDHPNAQEQGEGNETDPSPRGSWRTEKPNYWKLCNQFRWTFAREVSPDDDQRHFPVHFLGVWDTVSSVGWVWDPRSYPYSASNPSVATVRHAVSLDERRCFFRQNLFKPARDQDCRELWFPGAHCDVGGGYKKSDGCLWLLSFKWMLAEASNAGLRIDDGRLARVLRGTNSTDPWNDQIHESLKGKWWLAEFFPKMVWRPDGRRRPELGRGRPRRLDASIELHRSILLRLQGPKGYAPPNLAQQFREHVKGLSEVPDTMTYTP